MALSINDNVLAFSTATRLGKVNSLLQNTIKRLSTGRRINSAADDAGGLAVSVKMNASISRISCIQDNINNGMSYLETQDGVLESIGNVLNRISELRTYYGDVTKSDDDKANYYTEYAALKKQLDSLKGEKFNGVSMFNKTLGAIITSEDGAQKVTMTKVTVAGAIASIAAANATAFAALTFGQLTNAIDAIAKARASNGAVASRLQITADNLAAQQTNLMAAYGRIVNADAARESSELARLQVVSQANNAMMAQANSIPQAALQLLRG